MMKGSHGQLRDIRSQNYTKESLKLDSGSVIYVIVLCILLLRPCVYIRTVYSSKFHSALKPWLPMFVNLSAVPNLFAWCWYSCC